jgi:hypothetical protein
MDLEAVEMGFRAVLHQAGAAALTQLLQFPEPAADERSIPCPCGHQARYREMRSRRLLSALGEVELSRPWYLCPHCHNGQFPLDRQLDVENRDCSPGVRRMQAIVGQEAPFDHGRQQMKVLAGLEVTAKSVERTAEAIGADIAAGEQSEIPRSLSEIDFDRFGSIEHFCRRMFWRPLSWVCEQELPNVRSGSAVSAASLVAGLVAGESSGTLHRRTGTGSGSVKDLRFLRAARRARESRVSPGDDGAGAGIRLLRGRDEFAADRARQL